MARYQYELLPRSPPTIRLLSLAPAQNRESPLYGRLDPVQIDSHLPYIALSYRWGAPGGGHTINIEVHDGVASLEIWPNLASALRHVRSSTKGKAMWIDAICINQEDLAKDGEKSAQLQLMTDIYRNASVVLSWLGEPSPQEVRLFESITELAYRWDDLERKAAQYQHDSTPPPLPPRPGHRPLARANAQELSRPIMSLLHREYFCRIWIVQEVGMGGSRVVVQLGDEQTSWDQLVKAIALIMQDGKAIGNQGRFNNILMLDAARGAEAANVFEKKPQGSETLLNTLWRYRQFDAGEDRDKVYALLGLARDDESKRAVQAEVTYDKDQKADQKVFLEAASAIVKHGDLSILCVPRGGHESPSWVPDWTLRDPCMSLSLNSVNTARGFHPTAPIRNTSGILSPDGLELKLRAVFLPQRIEQVGPELDRTDAVEPNTAVAPGGKSETDQLRMLDRMRNDGNTLLTWEAMAKAAPRTRNETYPGAAQTQPPASGPGSREARGQAFGRTLLAGRRYEHMAGDVTSSDAYEIWDRNNFGKVRQLRAIGLTNSAVSYGLGTAFQNIVSGVGKAMGATRTPSEYEVYIATQFQNELAAAATGKRFFVTEDGLYGMGPRDLRVSDSIVLVLGAPMPLVVRRVGRGEMWELVGDVYMHSDYIMGGQAWEEGHKVDLRMT